MADASSEKKLRRAERLRKRHGGLWGLFWRPDYYESAELFLELAKSAETVERSEQYCNEAAETFLLQDEEYSYFRAAEVYKELRDAYIGRESIEGAIRYGKLYASNLTRAGRHMLAGQAYSDLGDACADGRPTNAHAFYTAAAAAYRQDGNCQYHLKKAVERCLAVELGSADYERAVDTIGQLDVKFARLCRLLLLILLEKPLDEELDDPAENRVVMAIINRGSSEATAALDAFANDNFLPKYAQTIFDAVRDSLRPENEMC
ncbi:hypothetical protein PAPHI01_0860 [Pancytospora philotis]|nr:hypothetical protein PAPHI01_0860 [Pancytospora philotis]